MVNRERVSGRRRPCGVSRTGRQAVIAPQPYVSYRVTRDERDDDWFWYAEIRPLNNPSRTREAHGWAASRGKGFGGREAGKAVAGLVDGRSTIGGATTSTRSGVTAAQWRLGGLGDGLRRQPLGRTDCCADVAALKAAAMVAAHPEKGGTEPPSWRGSASSRKAGARDDPQYSPSVCKAWLVTVAACMARRLPIPRMTVPLILLLPTRRRQTLLASCWVEVRIVLHETFCKHCKGCNGILTCAENFFDRKPLSSSGERG